MTENTTPRPPPPRPALRRLLSRQLPDDAEACAAARAEALEALAAIMDKRTILERGDWQGWHRGDKKINIVALAKLTENTQRR